MQQLTTFLDQHFGTLLTVAVVWVFVRAMWRYVRQRERRKAFRDHEAANPRFQEAWVSGRSLKNWQTRLGGARNCLRVTVNDTEVLIRPLFPFDLFSAKWSDLEHRIPRHALIAVEERRTELSRSVLLRFHHVDGGERGVEVFLRDQDAFMRALGRLQSNQDDPRPTAAT